MSKGRKPTHTLSVLHKETGKQGKIGAAWEEEDGSFSITLEAGVTIGWNDGFIIKLFPKLSDKEWAKRNAQKQQLEGADTASEDEEPPF